MEEYNITRPLSIILEAGALGAPYAGDWQDPITGDEMDDDAKIPVIARAYERNGFMRLNPGDDGYFMPNYVMGRRVDPEDHPAAPGDMAIVPPNPPDSDFSTPSPVRARRRGHKGPKYGPRSRTPDSPSRRRPGGGGGQGGEDDEDDNDDDDNGDGQQQPQTGRGRGKPPPGRSNTGGLATPQRLLFQ